MLIDVQLLAAIHLILPPAGRAGRHPNMGQTDARVRASQADIIILVTSRPSEDVMAVYDANQESSGNFLWQVIGQGGFQSGETPLVTQF